MIKKENYNFEVSFSVDNYFNKQQSTAAICGDKATLKDNGLKMKMGFVKETLNPQQMLDKCLHGYTFANLFGNFPQNGYGKTYVRKTDGAFSMTAKSDVFFQGSYVIAFDIEHTSYGCAKDFISKLCYEPTFYYSTFSNQQQDKGARFRLVYVFDELIKTKEFYAHVWDILNEQVECNCNEKTFDKCTRKCSQYFNGTNVDNPDLVIEFGISNKIYSLCDFNINYDLWVSTNTDNNTIEYTFIENKEEQDNIEDNIEETTYYSDLEKVNQTIDDASKKCSKALISKMKEYEYDDFMKYHRHQYKFIYRVEKEEWIDGIYQFIDKDKYFSLYWNINSIKNGNQRRKKLYHRMCLRRVMFPEVDADTLLFCAYEDLHRFFDNSDNDDFITIDCLVKNVENAMKLEISDIEDYFSDTINYLKSKQPKSGIIIKRGTTTDLAERNKLISSIKEQLVMEVYDFSMSVKENLAMIEETLFPISIGTLYNYLRKNNTDTNTIKEDNRTTEDNNILYSIENNEPNLTAEKLAEKYGYSTSRVKRIFKRLQEQNKIKNNGTNRKPVWVVVNEETEEDKVENSNNETINYFKDCFDGKYFDSIFNFDTYRLPCTA